MAQYTVASGDTLSGIGAKFGLNYSQSVNGGVTGFRSGNPNGGTRLVAQLVSQAFVPRYHPPHKLGRGFPRFTEFSQSHFSSSFIADGRPLSVVERLMLRLRNYLKILDSVVALVSIYVVDMFVSSKSPAEGSLDHRPMLKDITSFITTGVARIPLTNIPATVGNYFQILSGWFVSRNVSSLTNAGAELCPIDLVGVYFESLITKQALFENISFLRHRGIISWGGV